MDSRQRYQRFFELEHAHRLYQIRFKQFAVWSAFRVYFDYDDLIFKKLFDAPVEKIKITWSSLGNYIRLMARFNGVRLLLKKKKYIILEHPRSVNGRDIYTSDINDLLGSAALNISFSMRFRQLRDETIYLDTYKIISKAAGRLVGRFLPDRLFGSLRIFLNEFDSSHHIYRKFKYFYVEFVAMYYMYLLLFKYHKPQSVFVVVGYENGACIAAAHSCNIPIYEIQHGVIFRYHLGYSYPYDPDEYRSILPTGILLFSHYWKNNLLLPDTIQRIVTGNNTLGFKPYTESKEPNSILFVSQGVIGVKLARYLLDNLPDLEEYTLYFKLHPSEFAMMHERYAELEKASHMYENLHIIKQERTVAELQETAEFQVGVFSTAIYEGIQRHCQTVLIEMEGVEAVEDLIDHGLVDVAEPSEALKNFLSGRPKRNVEKSFFDLFSAESMAGVI